MFKSKGFVRLILLVVFIIPVGWYLILVLFGNNKFELPIQGEADCVSPGTIQIVFTDGIKSRPEINQYNRLKLQLKRRNFEGDSVFQRSCRMDSSDLLLIDSKRQIRGAYTYTKSDVDRLLVELDILRGIESYGATKTRKR